MATLHLIARKLTAALDTRTLTGVLLPYGEPGLTSQGKVTASAGSLTVANPLDPLTLEHDPRHPVGQFDRLEETPAGILATVRLLATRAGDDALVEAAAGVRSCLSVEVDNPVIRSGRLVAGIITGGSLVAQPAFPSARLTAAELEDAPDQGEDVTPAEDQDQGDEALPAGDVVSSDTVDETHTFTAGDGTTYTTTTHSETNTTEERPTMTAPATLQASALAPGAGKPAAGKAQLFAALAGYAAGNRKLLAALSDVVPADILGIEQAQYVGELWSGKAYQRKIIPLFNHDSLTSFVVEGWRWVTKPAVAAYTGNKTAVPSAAIETERVPIDAKRYAGAHDIDRKFRDFGNPQFWAAYFAAMTESAARVSDAMALTDIVAVATPVVRGAVPSGVAPGIVSIVDGMLAILAATDTVADSAVVAPNLWREIILTRSEDALAYLSAAVGMEDGTLGSFTIRPSAQLAADQVLVSCKSAVTVHELGGEAPIRVEALDIANGGVDEGVFGYIAINVHDEDGLALVEPA